MGKLLESSRILWIEAQLRAPPLVQRNVIPRLHKAKEIIRSLIKPYLTVYQLQGQGQGGSLTVILASSGDSKPFLKSILFANEPLEREMGRVPVSRLSELASTLSGDIVIIEAATHLVRRLPRQNAFVMPPRVELMLDVQGDWQDVRRRLHRSVRFHDLRLIRKYGYEYETSHSDQDFELFYHDMYLPSMQVRHAELASPESFREAYQYFRHGWLFLVKRDGNYVSGGLCQARQGVVNFKLTGVIKADEQLMHEGAQAAVYYAVIHWANQEGYETVNFEGCRSYVGTGLFQYKRKWGSAVNLPPHQHKQIWIKVLRNTPAVFRFLRDNPCIIFDEKGKLQALIVTEDPAGVTPEIEATWRKKYETPGLNGLLILSMADLLKEPTYEGQQ